jgi:hypothetical protein
LLKRIEKPDFQNLGYETKLNDGSEPCTNAAAYADDLRLYTGDHDDMWALLFLLSNLCDYVKMKINVDKFASISQA